MWRRTACFVIVVLGITGSASAQFSLGFSFWGPPCVTVGTYGWWGPRAVPYQVVDPELAVIRTSIRPKHTRLYLDGTFIGLATDFDSSPDYLYLERGRYRLEAELGGYSNHVVEIDARRGRAYEIKVRMERISGQPKEGWWDRPDRPKPLPRVYAKASPPAGDADTQPVGPDLRLRPDLQPPGSRAAAGGEPVSSPGASVRLRIQPDSASVYLDGDFLATAKELNRMIAPLAVQPGQHTFVIMAPGFETHTIEVDTATEAHRVTEIALEPGNLGVDNS